MKRTVLILTMLLNFNLVQCLQVTMPSQEILHAHLCKAGFSRVDEKLNLSQKLGSQQMEALEVVKIVQDVLHHYCKGMSPSRQIIIKQRRTLLVGALLQDFPKALQELEEAGVYKRRRNHTK